MNYSVCVDAVFRGLEMNRALEQVKDCGFSFYEFWGWKNRDLDAIKKKADTLGLHCGSICTTSFRLNDPAGREEFLAGLNESIPAARKLGAAFLITQGGEDTGAVRPYQHKAIVAGLTTAAQVLKGTGITLLLEPLNTKVDHPGCYLESSGEGFEIIDEVGEACRGESGSEAAGPEAAKSVRLLFDIYHQQISEGDVIRRMTANLDKIGYLHAAGNPGRHELDSGELDYIRIFKALDTAGYQGAVGLEYFPRDNPAAGLKRLKAQLP
jgi:hydroxypyruvate isomerase